tara:strand:+ start:359 stop:907 length:549 start_codon:yes stop_codon:yes gene_type:complete
MKNSKRPQSAVLGSSGEHLVLSHLLKRGFIAGLAPENTKDYDIIVLNKDGTTSFPIQVKTTLDNKSGWILQKKHENPITNLFFCFVNLSLKSDDAEIFIVDSKTVSEIISNGHRIWLKLPNRTGGGHKDTDMRKISRIGVMREKYIEEHKNLLTKKDLSIVNKYKKDWIEKYRDAWHLIDTN